MRFLLLGIVIRVCGPTVFMLSATDICTAAIAQLNLCHSQGPLTVGEMRLGQTIIQPMQ